jgi:hypothetical protein
MSLSTRTLAGIEAVDSTVRQNLVRKRVFVVFHDSLLTECTRVLPLSLQCGQGTTGYASNLQVLPKVAGGYLIASNIGR